jgi:hypothetical protein
MVFKCVLYTSFGPYVLLSYQEVLLDVPPIAECEAKCALFYSISSTQVSKVLMDCKYEAKKYVLA